MTTQATEALLITNMTLVCVLMWTVLCCCFTESRGEVRVSQAGAVMAALGDTVRIQCSCEFAYVCASLLQPLRAQCCSVSVRALQSHSHTNNTMSLMSLQLFLLDPGAPASSGEISLTQTPKAAAVDKGASVTLRCQCSSSVGNHLQWYLQKGTESPKLLVYDGSSRFSGVSSRFSGSNVGSGSVDYSLTISGFEAEDAGVYYCQQDYTSFTQ
ncbi:hypothetical protein WMY93_019081 [Mugilogobius chulae]|uniref:Ig-like domain-containing protein n=1 Tax=Mugilogobius chulae TaxID=88201 RepID=A0AAW0NEB6_9GOBI